MWRWPPQPPSDIHVLSEDEITRLLDSINPTTANGARNYAIVILMLDAGPRVGEVAGARLADLDFANQRLRVFGKGSKWRTIDMGIETAEAIMRYVHAYRPEPVNDREGEFLFLSVDGREWGGMACKRL